MNEFTGFLFGYAIGLAIYAAGLFCYDKYMQRGYLIDTKKRRAARLLEEQQLVTALYASFSAQSAYLVGVALIGVQSDLHRAKAEKKRHEQEQAAWNEHMKKLQALELAR